MDVVLEHLAPPAPAEGEQLEDLRFDPATLAALSASESKGVADPSSSVAEERRVAAELLASDRPLAALLPEIESSIRDHFGADAQIDRAVVTDPDDADGRDRLYLRVGTELPFDQQVERLTALLDHEEDRLEPFEDRLTIGTL